MSSTTTTLTTKVVSGTPYQLNSAQVFKASSALLKHIGSTKKERARNASKKDLLAEADDDTADLADMDETPIWLNVTTKKHIIDQNRLKPGKVVLPHPLNASPSTTICLITADPQRTYKDIIASPAFPPALAQRITRVIGVTKLKQKYHQYEAQRQLLAEHDMFLADDRIITRLPQLLGKTFFKSSTKRPIPVNVQAPAPRTEGKRIAKAKGDGSSREIISPQQLANEIEKTFKTALVALSPSTLTSVRVAFAGWSAEDVAENIEAVANELVEKYVPQKWRGVRALHIKGPETAAMPIWLADELWTDDKDVLEDVSEEQKAIEANISKKRKNSASTADGKKRKAIEAPMADSKKLRVESDDTNLDKEIALRKEKLRKQKQDSAKSLDDAAPVLTTKKARKV